MNIRPTKSPLIDEQKKQREADCCIACGDPLRGNQRVLCGDRECSRYYDRLYRGDRYRRTNEKERNAERMRAKRRGETGRTRVVKINAVAPFEEMLRIVGGDSSRIRIYLEGQRVA